MPPTKYITTAIFALGAFGAAMASEKVVPRVIGLAYLVFYGAAFTIIGVMAFAVVDILIGIAAIAAAIYSWWYNQV